MNNIYIIEDGHNTNYISCLILSLFLEKNIIYNHMLENDNVTTESLYIQQIIKTIISDFRNYKILNSKILNYFRNILYFNNFKEIDNCIIELYDYFIQIFNIIKIEFLNISNMSCVESYSYLNLDATKTFNTNIKELLKINLKSLLLNNIPHIIGIKIIRDNLITSIDIMKKISFDSIYNFSQNENKLIWEIKSIICFDIINSNYFSYLNFKNTWLLINEKLFPSMQKIDIKLHENTIKLNSVFLIYNYCN